MSKVGLAAASVAAFIFMASVSANAALVEVTGSPFAGNPNADGNNNGVNNDISDEILAFNGDTTIEELARFNIGGAAEDKAVSASAFTLTFMGDTLKVDFDLTGLGYGFEYIALKFAQSFSLFYWDMPNQVTGSFTVAIPDNLSNVSFYGDDTPEIPIPGAIWLMGAGLAGLGFARRKAKSA